MSYRPYKKVDVNGTIEDIGIDAETVKGVDVVTTKQDLLVDSGVDQNIKTINGNSILGSGNINITATDEKARKLLGEFDVYPYNNDNKKVLRQTGYINEEYLRKYGELVFNNTCLFVGVSGYARSDAPVCNKTLEYSYSWDGNSTHWYYENGAYIIIVRLEDLSGIQIQYKQTTSYVENVIPSGQILNLDSNGCQFVRDEWEKQLNLFTKANYVSDRAINVDKTFTTNSEIAFSNISGADPYAYMNFKGFEIGKQYTISYLSDQVLQSAFFGGGGNAVINYGTYGSYTFTADATTYEIGFEFNTTGYTTCNIKVMLNYGEVAYPYQENNGKLAHIGIDNNFSKEQTITSPTTDTPLRIKGNSNDVCDIMFIGANDSRFSWLSAHSNGYLYDYRNNAYHRLAEIDDVNTKLDKLTYEYNFENRASGSENYLYIGDFPMYDSNLTIEITSTTSVSKYGVLVLATQNIDTSRGGVWNAYVYGDADNRLCSNLYIQYSSGSANFKVYLNTESYSKNTIHIKAVALAGTPTIQMTYVSSLPSTDLISIFNRLNDNFLKLSGGTMTGALNIVGNSNERANINLVSSYDIPNDLYFGSNNSNKWSITSRDSSEGYLIALYSNITQKYLITADANDVIKYNGYQVINPLNAGDHNEGIRILPKSNYSVLMLLGSDVSSQTHGTSANSWGLYNNNGNFYLTRSGASVGTRQISCDDNKWTLKNGGSDRPVSIQGSSSACWIGFNTNEGNEYAQFTIFNGRPRIYINSNNSYHEGAYLTDKVYGATKLIGEDTRSTNSAPSAYYSETSIKTEFKYADVIGYSGSSWYGQLITMTPWTDQSGSRPFQIFASSSQNSIGIRYATNDSTWGTWNEFITAGNISSYVSSVTLYRHIVFITQNTGASSSPLRFVFVFYNTSANDITLSDLLDWCAGNGSAYAFTGVVGSKSTYSVSSACVIGPDSSSNANVRLTYGSSAYYTLDSSWDVEDNCDEV